MTTTTAAATISEARAGFIRSLLTERAVPADAETRLRARLDAGTVSPEDATKAIAWLRRQPRSVLAEVQSPEVDAATVPAGSYALETNDAAANRLAFYKVDRPDAGRWAGFVFVRHIVGDDEERLSRRRGEAILRRIADVGAAEASAAYGREIGACGVCGRTLTNDASRAAGIGPVCAQGNNW